MLWTVSVKYKTFGDMFLNFLSYGIFFSKQSLTDEQLIKADILSFESYFLKIFIYNSKSVTFLI